MKKIRILLISVCVLYSLSALANDEYIKVRQNVASGLNGLVKDLKDYFKLSEDKLNTDAVALEEQKDKAEALKERSEASEVNPTILKHGSESMARCDYKTQELKWKNNRWVCENPLYKTDCIPSTGEVKVSDGNGGFICKQKGDYKNISLGWGVCNNSIGETHTQVACMFTNGESGKSYQVASGCTNSIARKEKACGPNGARSTCKCSSGYSYIYEGGEGKCRGTVDAVVVGTKTYNRRFCTDHFTRLQLVKDGNDIVVMFVAQNPSGGIDTRCGYRDYSSSWLNSKGLKGRYRGAYMHVARIKGAAKIASFKSFRYTYKSSGSGCVKTSGSGVGNATSGSSGSSSYVFDKRSLTNCPAPSAQNANITVVFKNIIGKKYVYKPVNVCALR